MLAFWLDRARRLRRCGVLWTQMTPEGARAYNITCRRRSGHDGQHESQFGTRWN